MRRATVTAIAKERSLATAILRRSRSLMGVFFSLALIGNAAALRWHLSAEPWPIIRLLVSVLFLVALLSWAYWTVTVRRAAQPHRPEDRSQ